jgi:hypothetical protein
MSIGALPRINIVEAAVIILVAVGSLYAVARIALTPRDLANGVAVIFAPWTNGTSSLTRAVMSGGRFVRYGRQPFIVVVVPEVPDYLSRAFANGAVLVVDPRALGGCLSVFSNATQLP